MENKTATNKVSDCKYCMGSGYLEIHNAYDDADIAVELCPKCNVILGNNFYSAEKIYN